MGGLLGLFQGLFKKKGLTRGDKAIIYEGAVEELEKGQDELGRMGDHYLADNPYYIELLNEYPDFYDWEKNLDYFNVGSQKHSLAPRMLHKGYDDSKFIYRFEEAKKDTNYFNPAVYDSLIQAYNFDKLGKRDD
jgi:subtilase family serine protease